MIVSLNWLKKFTSISGTVDELSDIVGSRLVEIESVVDLSRKYTGVIIARVASCHKLEGSDHLSVVKIDDSNKVSEVERDESGFVQVVCGASNVRAGMLIAWLPPGVVVPETFGSATPFLLGSRKLRGVMSAGMIASAKELDLYNDNSGILEIDKDVEPGTSFIEAYELDDYLFDIENKSLTHRPDCFGLIGFAREVAGVQGRQFTSPAWLSSVDPVLVPKDETHRASVTVDDPELSSRYQAVVIDGVNNRASLPIQIKSYLARIGVRPISPIVDVTNYLMMASGQPLHAFDYDKLAKLNDGQVDIHVRGGRKGEKLELLDGREVQLAPDDIVIANGDVAVALAGAMGGAATEVDENTKTVLLESATFNLYNLRATQMRHGIFSEAITRFTKGQPAGLTAPVLARAVEMLGAHAEARLASSVIEDYPKPQKEVSLDVSVNEVNNLLGTKFSTSDVLEILQNVEFNVSVTDAGLLKVVPPYWRADINITEDIIEEVGRLSGFDHIEPTLPKRDFVAVKPSKFDQFRAMLRTNLVRAGANEVLTYSFIHGDVLKKANLDLDDSYQIINSISPDLQYYRQSLMPSLLSLVHSNIKAGHDEFALFELNKVHAKSAGMTPEGVPIEMQRLGLVYASKGSDKGASYYRAKRYADYLASRLNISVVYVPIGEGADALVQPFEPKRSAYIRAKSTGDTLGVVGEFKKSVARNFKLPLGASGFEVDTELLSAAAGGIDDIYSPLSRYPSSERDICFQVASYVTYQAIIDSANETLKNSGLETEITPIDIYQVEESNKKNITIRVRMTSHDKTLAGKEVTAVMNDVASTVIAATDAVVI